MQHKVEAAPVAVWPGLATIYVAWGSTFLAISVAVRTLPPFLAMSVRHLVAGSLLFAWAYARGPRDRIGPRQLVAAAIFGGALFVGSHGGLAWAQQRIPSGVAALVVASIPLWAALLDRVAYGRRLSGRAIVALAVGFLGVALLVDPTGAGPIDRVGALVALAAAASWAAGSLYSRDAPLPASPVASAGLASIVGGVLLALVSLGRGEVTGLEVDRVSGESIAGVAYLVVVGSLIGLSSYVWLLRVAPISLVATYAFVNPVIAVVLGWAILDEDLHLRILAAGAAIVVAVALAVTAPTPERATGRALVRADRSRGRATADASPPGTGPRASEGADRREDLL